jgi:hypothetical protein
MERFVIINDKPHQILKNLTYSTPLVRTPEGTLHKVEYDVRNIGEKIPDLYFFITWKENLEKLLGVPTEIEEEYARERKDEFEKLLDMTPEQKQDFAKKRDYLDITRIDPRCFGTKRVRFPREGPSILSYELLNFGVGALRRKWDNQLDPLHKVLRINGQIVPAKMEAREIPSHYYSSFFMRTLDETWQSTNLIYGDVFGELRQIYDRRDDIGFVNDLLKTYNLVKMNSLPTIHCNEENQLPKIVGFNHYSSGNKWSRPPRSGKELIKRIDFILSHSYIDTNPRTVYAEPEKPITNSRESL